MAGTATSFYHLLPLSSKVDGIEYHIAMVVEVGSATLKLFDSGGQ
jgi:hypothetical protein